MGRFVRFSLETIRPDVGHRRARRKHRCSAKVPWCETNGIDFIFGLAKNVRLNRAIGAELVAARQESQETGRPARRFNDFMWSTRQSWSRQRRVIAKAEWTQGEANPRFIGIMAQTPFRLGP